ncbi:hypothetical protein AALP_AA6G176400 [Arabis alpina]|uniref:Uncharacterized protein n=1 Tax=Arabis alpina TaxID=50452 RepID=A0A087GPW9_ARAAL|nr:hypothetical protein AALP_AA6G176400 [Arabis alpina]
MAKTKVGAPRGRGQGTGGGGGRGGGGGGRGGGSQKTSKGPAAADGGSPPLSKADGKRTAADGGSPPLSKAYGKRPAAAGGSQSVSKTQDKDLAPSSGTKRLAAPRGPNLAGQDKDTASPTKRVRLNSGQTSSINSNRQHTTHSQGTPTSQGTVSVSRTRDIPLQYPPLSNRLAPPAFRLSPELNLNLQPGSREIEMEDEEEEEDEEDDEEGGDDAVEDMEV